MDLDTDFISTLPDFDLSIINFALSHPIKMQIVFYLVSLGELSLTQLSELIDKTKTTVHHHTRKLEKQGLLITRELKKKNYSEKLYTLKPEIEKFFKSRDKIFSKIGNINSSKTTYLVLRSFNAFFYSILEHYSKFIKKCMDSQEITAQSVGALGLCITDSVGGELILESISETLKNLPKKFNEQNPPKDSKSFIFALVPYSKMFEHIKK